MVQPVLYKDLTINLRRDWSSLRWLERLLDEEASGLKYTTGLSVLITPDFRGKTSSIQLFWFRPC